MAFACTVLPMPKEAIAAKSAKRMASHFQPRPFSKAYIGPPNMRPRWVFTRYFTANKPSAYFVDIPNTPVSQHHSTAPGPPRAMAVATPMMLPVPIVAARAVARAPNWETSPVAFLSFLTDNLMALKILRCGKCRRIVRKRCVPKSRIIMGQPHKNELSVAKMSFSVSIISLIFYLFVICLSLLLSHVLFLSLRCCNPWPGTFPQTAPWHFLQPWRCWPL